MQPIPLKKRILYYLVLLPISYIALMLYFGTYFLYLERVYTIPIHFTMYCVFGVIFIKTKLIIRLVVAFVVALVSYITTWLIVYYDLFFDTGGLWIFFQYFLVSIILWEIAYQILKCRKNE